MMDHTLISKTINKEKLLPGIHGLRGIAAISIVLFHLHYIAGLKIPGELEFIGRDLGYSVHLFFILSAFSLMHSTESRINTRDWCVEYFIRRLFRIAPLFYAVLAFELSRQLITGGIQSNIPKLILNLSFTTGFSPFTEIVWGGWSIGVEMIFYAFFPAIILLTRTHFTALIITALSIVICYSLRYSLNIEYSNNAPVSGLNWSYFAFAPNFCFFMMGVYAYRVTKIIDKDSSTARFTIPIIASSMIIALAFLGLGPRTKDGGSLDIILWGLGFTSLVIWQAIAPCKTVASKFFDFVGERSFSIYLLHPIITHFSKDSLREAYDWMSPYIGSYSYFPCAVALIAAILFCTEITYRLIEVPGIGLGRKIIKRRKRLFGAEDVVHLQADKTQQS